MFNFEKLDVWQEAIQFADLVYELTGDFPDGERFGLTNQMRRAAVCYAGAPPSAPGRGGVTSGAATTCLGGFSAGIF